MPAFMFAVTSAIIFAGLCVPFINALKEEAPELYESLGKPSVFKYIWRKQLFMPFSNMILNRSYRSQLANCPRSRAWASWLFIAHWVQFVALILFIFSWKFPW
jgi:thiosulfate reductase cytochrome b subunit